MTRDRNSLEQVRRRVISVLSEPPVLAFLPALTLAAWWLGGEAGLIGTALGLPLIYAALGLNGGWDAHGTAPRDALTGLMQSPEFEALAGRTLADCVQSKDRSACLIVDLSEIAILADRHGQTGADSVVLQLAERLGGALRGRGHLARIGDGRFAIVLQPQAGLDLEYTVQLAGSLHAAAEMPVTIGPLNLTPTCCIGFCLSPQMAGRSGADWMDAAQEAMATVRRAGPSGISGFTAELQKRAQLRADLRAEVGAALDNGQILPWFQPQISTDTGKVTGFEALARWAHPTHGMIPPDTFLPVMQDAGLLERLGEVILRHSLEAVQRWDRAGVSVPRVGVNFAGDELSNPMLVDKVNWELDRLDLGADRLSVEILETVVSDAPDERVTRNIAGLAALGCRIDLDDFGTGHASLASVKRFSVSRLKIDKGFVAKADRDQQQQRLIGAILIMAERLGLETLAEGVETPGEHTLLAQLGCDHVQGFGIGRPMPFEATLDWIKTHEMRLSTPPWIGRHPGRRTG